MIEHKAQCGPKNVKNRGYQAAIGIAVISTLLLVPMACYIVYTFYSKCRRIIDGYEHIDGRNNNPNEPNNNTENIEPNGQQHQAD